MPTIMAGHHATTRRAGLGRGLSFDVSDNAKEDEKEKGKAIRSLFLRFALLYMYMYVRTGRTFIG